MSRAASRHISLAVAGLLVLLWAAIHYGAIFFVPLSLNTVPLALPLVIVQAWVSTGLFIIAHDAMHGSLAPGQPRLCDRIGRLTLMLYACLDYDRLRTAHFLHHRHAGLADDPDFNPNNPRAFLPWLGRFFFGYYTHAQLARITLAACVYLLLGASLINIAVFWAVPALLAMLQLFYFGTYLPHRAGADGFADRHRARSSAMPAWAGLITCFNFGACHHEHHLYPETPWWALPSRRRTS